MSKPFVRDDVQMVLQMMEASDQPLMSEIDPPMAREMYLAMALMFEADPVELARVEDLTCTGPAGDIPLRLYDAQADRSEATNVIIFYHGGGFVIGNLESHHAFCTKMAADMGLPVIAVDYRLAPEAPFPAAPEDAVAATRWIAENGDALKLDISGLIPCGDSAGGNLAIVVTQACMAQAAARPVVAQFPIYPATQMDAEGGSMDEFAEGFLLTRDTMDYFAHHYSADHTDARVSAILGPVEGTPPTVVVTAGLDPLRDQGRAYAADLINHGVTTTYLEMAGNVHGFINIRKAVPSAESDVEKMFSAWKAMLATL